MQKTVAVVAVLVASAALADAPVKKGFWKTLAKPSSKWVLYDTFKLQNETDKAKVPRLVVETYDTRKIGDADVSRLRWTVFDNAADKQGHALDTCAGCYTQIAVNAQGMYIVSDAKDDAQIAASLKKDKPSRSEPPKSYSPTKQNDGRYLKVKDGLVCYGEVDPPPDGMCPDVCFASMCVSPDKGIVTLAGKWAPDEAIYAQDGFEQSADMP